MKRLLAIVLACAIVALAGVAKADSWPSRPIKLIVPTGPGAATDVMARLLADGVSRTLGQPVFVENIPCASGILAHQAADSRRAAAARRKAPHRLFAASRIIGAPSAKSSVSSRNDHASPVRLAPRPMRRGDKDDP